MGIKRKPTSRKKRRRKLSTDDRLSELPEDVICHILSFLPTKESAQTCVLAKRWTSLWAHVPCFDLDRNDHRQGSASMSHVINRVLSLRKGANINTFHLNHVSCRSDVFEPWIADLIAHNLQNLSVSLYFQFDLPQCLFSCKTLVDLCLRNCLLAIPPGTVELPSLKKLRLEPSVDISSLGNLISGCPVLEELIINVMVTSYTNPLLNISSPTLKRLHIVSRSRRFVCEVKFNTPALTYLRLQDFVTNDFSPGALTSLTEADVAFFRLLGRDVIIMSPCSVLKFVGRLYNVKSLRLKACSMEVDDYDDSAFSAVLTTTKKFHNLTFLVLDADWRLVSFFLENADNLQVLCIYMFDRRIKNWTEPDQVAVCVSKHLRKVTVREFGFTEGEFELVSYLLRNGKVMKLMDIYFLEHGDGEKQRDAAVEKISNYCRGSGACELVFHPFSHR